MEFLNIRGIASLDPCLSMEFDKILIHSGPAEVLHFRVDRIQSLEIRDNPNLKTVLPSSYFRSLDELIITGNPELRLA